MSTMPKVGVGVIITKGAQVLLLRRQNVHGAGSWSTPGGHLEFGESPEACAIRETREETGLEIAEVRFRAITNDVFEAEGKHYITIWMEGVYAGGEPVVNAAYEMAEVGWFAWGALPQPLFPSFRHLLDGECHPLPEGGPATAEFSNQEMIEQARAVLRPRKLSFDNAAGSVACALLSASGKLHTGVCIDVGSGIGFCAEHSAIAAMITAGESRIARIVAVCEQDTVLPPCGRCREFMYEIDAANLTGTDVILGVDQAVKLRELLPHPYNEVWEK